MNKNEKIATVSIIIMGVILLFFSGFATGYLINQNRLTSKIDRLEDINRQAQDRNRTIAEQLNNSTRELDNSRERTQRIETAVKLSIEQFNNSLDSIGRIDQLIDAIETTIIEIEKAINY